MKLELRTSKKWHGSLTIFNVRIAIDDITTEFEFTPFPLKSDWGKSVKRIDSAVAEALVELGFSPKDLNVYNEGSLKPFVTSNQIDNNVWKTEFEIDGKFIYIYVTKREIHIV